MKRLQYIGCLLLFSLCLTSIAKNKFSKPLPSFNPLLQQEAFTPMKLMEPKTRTFIIHPGSLKKNIMRLANTFGWKKVIWKTHYDYKWTGTAKIKGDNVFSILGTILKKYPLQATFYKGNHILAIKPRNAA